MQELGSVYLIYNDINNKKYVGQTIQSLTRRFNQHCSSDKVGRSCNMYIKRAIHKYGRNNFHIVLLERCPIEQLNEREKYWIQFYHSYENGYNLTKGGQDSNYFNIHRLENIIDLEKFKNYIRINKPLVNDVVSYFNIGRCSVYNLIKRLNDPTLILQSHNPRKPKTVDNINKEELKKLYVEEGWSIQDLVKKYKVRKDKISNYLKSIGIKVHRGIYGYKHKI